MGCLGVTTKDWEQLGFVALEASQLDIARKAFVRTRDYKYLNLIAMFQDMKRQGNVKGGVDILIGYMNAYQFKYTEAAKAFRKAGQESLAMQMFTDLRMFDLAKEYYGSGTGESSSDKSGIVMKQAEWAIRNGDIKTAAELYMSAKQFNK